MTASNKRVKTVRYLDSVATASTVDTAVSSLLSLEGVTPPTTRTAAATAEDSNDHPRRVGPLSEVRRNLLQCPPKLTKRSFMDALDVFHPLLLQRESTQTLYRMHKRLNTIQYELSRVIKLRQQSSPPGHPSYFTPGGSLLVNKEKDCHLNSTKKLVKVQPNCTKCHKSFQPSWTNCTCRFHQTANLCDDCHGTISVNQSRCVECFQLLCEASTTIKSCGTCDKAVCETCWNNPTPPQASSSSSSTGIMIRSNCASTCSLSCQECFDKQEHVVSSEVNAKKDSCCVCQQPLCKTCSFDRCAWCTQLVCVQDSVVPVMIAAPREKEGEKQPTNEGDVGENESESQRGGVSCRSCHHRYLRDGFYSSPHLSLSSKSKTRKNLAQDTKGRSNN